MAALVVVVYAWLRASALFLIGAFNDDGAYVMLGKSLAAGTGYRLTYLVGAPVAVKFPPALPALLAIPWRIGGTLASVRATVAILNPLACGAAAALIWRIGRRDLGIAPLPLLVFAIGPFFLDQAIQYYAIPIAEPYFLLGWAAAVVLTATVTRPSQAIVLGLVLATTTLFRSAGIVLIPACLGAIALRRVPWRVVTAGAAAALVPLLIWGVVHARMMAAGPLSSSPDEVSYLSLIPFGPIALPSYLVHALWKNTRVYFLESSATLGGPVVLGHMLVLGLLGATLLGAVQMSRRAPWWPVLLTTAVSLALVLIWPFGQTRFLLPLLPFIGLLAAAGIDAAARRVPTRFRLATPVALALTVLIVGLRQTDLRATAAAGFVRGEVPPRRDWSILYILAMNSRHIAAMTTWVGTQTKPADRLLVDFPAATHLYSGRLTEPASPAEAGHTPSVFRYPGHYLTHRILEDSITVVALGIPGLILADIETVSRLCPSVLRLEHPSPPYYRVTRDEVCLRRILVS